MLENGPIDTEPKPSPIINNESKQIDAPLLNIREEPKPSQVINNESKPINTHLPSAIGEPRPRNKKSQSKAEIKEEPKKEPTIVPIKAEPKEIKREPERPQIKDETKAEQIPQQPPEESNRERLARENNLDRVMIDYRPLERITLGFLRQQNKNKLMKYILEYSDNPQFDRTMTNEQLIQRFFALTGNPEKYVSKNPPPLSMITRLNSNNVQEPQAENNQQLVRTPKRFKATIVSNNEAKYSTPKSAKRKEDQITPIPSNVKPPRKSNKKGSP